MKTPLSQVLLIDDNPDDNYLHKRVIDRAGIAEKVMVVQSGKEALDYFDKILHEDGIEGWPQLVFLDINMPKMNGWEFLANFEKRFGQLNAPIIITMLTSSSLEEDIERSESQKCVSTFLNKPLTREMLDQLLESHFAEGD